MGTWGVGAFENDGAADWVGSLTDGGSISSLEDAITCVCKANSGSSIDLDEAIEAVAAAEVIAIARGHPGNAVPASVKRWINACDYAPADDVARVAGRAIARIARKSELRDEWNAEARWLDEIAGLAERLGKPAVRRRKSAQAKKIVSGNKPAAKSETSWVFASRSTSLTNATNPRSLLPASCSRTLI